MKVESGQPSGGQAGVPVSESQENAGGLGTWSAQLPNGAILGALD